MGIQFKHEEVQVDFLTQEELNRLILKEFEITRLEQIRDVFVFCCYTGLAFIDVKNLKEEPETIRRAVLGYMSAIMLNQINGKKGFLNRLAAILEIFENNWYDSGRASLVKACYEVCCLGE